MNQDFIGEIRSQLDRGHNPPWWAVWTRWINWTLRCEASLATGDKPAVRWLTAMVPVRLVVAVGIAGLIPAQVLSDDLSPIETFLYTTPGVLVLPYWAVGPLQRAVAFRHGFHKAEDEAVRTIAAMRRRQMPPMGMN